MNSIIISNDKNGIKLETNNQVKFITNSQTIKLLYDRLSESKITRCHNNKKKNTTSIMFNDTICRINDYEQIKKSKSFNNLNKQINYFKAKKIFDKFKNKKVAVIGSLVAVATISTAGAFANNQSDTESYNLDSTQIEPKYIIGHLELNEDKYDEAINNIVDNVQNNNTDNLSKISYEDEDVDPLSKANYEDEDIDPLSNINYEESDIEFDNLEKEEQLNDQSFSNTSQKSINNNVIDFSELQNFNSYGEYIDFAANLFGVDSNTAYKLIKENYEKFSEPGKTVNNVSSKELDRMKDLKNHGLIDGDINVIGIFLTIKDYALDNLNLANQTPIKSSKTPAEREKDVVFIAKYIYGVTNPDLMNTIIATCRTESGSGTSPAAQDKNNIGGNMKAGGGLNSYKTAEIGAESMVRNFLTIYDKSNVTYNYETSIPIPVLMSNIYCTHTPKEWAETVSGIIVDQDIEYTINNYLNEKTR